ncbi:hypothetical protein ACHHYP_01943 [Achlya hypogyna]|uniref:PDZ domain-containing protein n=1 Tax=Achlya hypogyna TaxID=1202772 RepID=A0A1V9ZST8_ACHHY|nr:hypothetical protein ACHHYP_01943 [Achlya hypogyna]
MDALGRLYTTVTVAAGRLGVSLVETEAVGVYVGGYEPLPGSMQDHRDRVVVGDRLVRINDTDVVHLTLGEVIGILIKTNETARRLSFLRAPASPTGVDIAKKLLVAVPAGPLGIELHQEITQWAIIDVIAPGSPLTTAHRGCRFMRIDDTDVSSMDRDAVVALLATKRDSPKTLELYCLAPATCESIFSLLVPVTFVSPASMLIAATSKTPECIVAAVGSTDLSALHPAAAQESVHAAPAGTRVLCYTVPAPKVSRSAEATTGAPIVVTITDSSLGLQIDGNESDHAKVTGFSTPADADRSYYAPHRVALPGMYITSVNGIDVSSASRDGVLGLIGKLPHIPRVLTFVSAAEIKRRSTSGPTVTVAVPPGSLAVDFDGNVPTHTVIAGFRPSDDGPGALEKSGLVAPGSILVGINGFNVSCLSLHSTIELLKKLAHAPKRLTFARRHRPTVDVYVPSGPLGLTFDTAHSDRAILETMAPTSAVLGVIAPGSALVGVDGFDISPLSLAKAADVLKSLSGHAKVLSFAVSVPLTTRLSNVEVVVPAGQLGLQFDSAAVVSAVVTGFAPVAGTLGIVESHGGVSAGSRLEWVDEIDVRAKPLALVVELLRDLSAVPKTLSFAPQWTPPAPAPASPSGKPELVVPFPVVRRDSATTDVTGLQDKLNLTDTQVRPPTMALRVAHGIVTQKQSLAVSSSGYDEIQAAVPAPKANFARVYTVQTVNSIVMLPFGWFGKPKSQQLEFDSDQKYLLVYDYDGTRRSAASKHIAIATLTSVVLGKTTPAFTKKAADRAVPDQCLSLYQGKKTIDYICVSPEDRDALATTVHALIKARKR